MNMKAIFMTPPVITTVVYGESTGFIHLSVVIVCGLLGSLRTREKPYTKMFFARKGFMMVSLRQIVLSFSGYISFVVSGETPHTIDAMSETVLGSTTTGSSIIPKVEGMSHTTLMWRSFSHRIGGMGILVLILAILPMAGDYSMHIMRVESPGPSVGKLVPKTRITAKPLYFIYLCMTIVMTILLLLGRMPLFGSIRMSFEVVGTGGFVYHNSGQVDYTVYQQTVITIFMLLFGVNFNAYCLLSIRRSKDAGWCEELRGYLAMVIITILLTTINIRSPLPFLFMALHQVTSQVPSITITTGYSTIDYNSWLGLSKIILLPVMFIGTCVGSTGDDMKVSRVMIVFKKAKKEMASAIHPHSVKVLESGGKPLEHNILRSLNVYIIVHFIIFGMPILAVSLDNYDFITSFSTVAANLNNIGPGMSVVGPSSNYSMMSYLSKIMLMFDMSAGRLEFFPMLVLLSPGTWKRD